ncbi:MAG: fused response regulator/phosphatase [Lentisphaerota bacterium]
MNIQKIQLLLVEDNPMDAALAQRLLQTLGKELPVDTCWVDSAEKALAELRKKQYDLVLLDYQLPGASGLDVLSELHNLPHFQQPAVIMLTASGSEKVAVEAMKSGAKDYLRKDELAAAPLTRAIMSALAQKRLQDQVEKYVEQTQAELRMARQLQHALLPQHFPTFPHTATDGNTALRFHSRYVPTADLGGDFYDVWPLSDTAAGVFICDVMGHGVRAALVTMMIRTLVEDLLPVAHEPGQFLAGINRGLLSVLKHSDEPLFATAFYMVVNVEQGTMLYANAGHPLPFHIQCKRGTVTPLTFAGAVSGPALGIFEAPDFVTDSQILSPHDVVLLFTDGLFEVYGADDKEFGQSHLLTAIQEHCHLPVEQLFDELIRLARQESGSGEFGDDVCLLGVEVERIGNDIGGKK